MSVFANGDMTDGSLAVAIRGIARPTLYTVPIGSKLYRFVDINRGPHRVQANSPWWFEFEPFENVRQFAERHGYTLDYCARLFLAVLHEYSAITGFVAAIVVRPLKAWRGPGSVQYSSGRDPRDPPRMIPMQSINETYQLFIPGLGRGSPVLDAAFTNITYHRI